MLTYRNTNIAFATLTVVVIAACYVLGRNYAYVLLLLPVYLSVLFWGSYFIHSNFHVHAICHGDRKQKKIAITFDDGPLPKHTMAILKVLREYNAKATFFCIGDRMTTNPDCIKMIDGDGHIVGNHSYSHSNFFDLYSPEKMLAELERTTRTIEQLLDKKPLYFRPPYGVTNPNLKKAIVQTGCTTIGWSLRSMDTVTKNEAKLLNKVTSALKPGDIVLFHDTQSGTVSVLGKFLDYCHQNGYEIVPLDELINKPAYA